MYKKIGIKKLGKPADQRRALIKSQVKDLISRGYLRTTKARGKVVVQEFDKLVNLFINKNLKQVKEYLMDKDLVEKLKRINFGDRKTGFASITKLKNRAGDNAEIVLVEILRS